MKIYTKKGDDGSTSLIGGKRVNKYDLRINSYGTIDELIAFTGLLRDHDMESKYKDALLFIQDRLMTCATLLATDTNDQKKTLPIIYEEDISFLENEIDEMEKKLPPLQSFLLPGGREYG